MPVTRQSSFGFPLLAKELTEQANRRRTYVVRFLYAAALFVLGVFAIAGDAGGDVRIGAGRDIFHNLVQMQFWLVLIFLPATASGALTIEKERDTLSLLLLTTIPPWSIVVQKYLSRLIPMLSFLLLAFPLMAVAYSYGGVATSELIGAIGLLLLFAVEVAAVSILCSSYCRTTGEAFVSTYFVLAVLAFLGVWPQTHFSVMTSQSTDVASQSTEIAMVTTQIVGIAAAQIGVIVTLGVSVICLLLAYLFLERRAFVPSRNVLLQLFQRLDKFYVDLNSVTGGVVLVKDGNDLPGEQPIAWRETSKKSLGTVRYLFRVLTVLEVPILFVAAAVNMSMVRRSSPVSALLYILWVVGAAMLCVHASGVIASERSRQTLDPLLTTPLTGADILLQKMAGVRRLMYVLLVPFASIYGFQIWFRGFDAGYFFGSFGSALIFLWLTAWGSLWIGLRVHSPMKAVLTSMFVVFLVCALPMVAESAVARSSTLADLRVPQILGSLSPANIIVGIENWGALHHRMEGLDLGLLLGMLPLYGLALLLIRGTCLQNADTLLKRLPEDPNADIDVNNADHLDDTEEPIADNEPLTTARV